MLVLLEHGVNKKMQTRTNSPYNKLPAPIYENYSWQERAKCRGESTELFFLPYNARTTEKKKRIMAAKAVCNGCPVIQECLDFALSTEEPYGVWGGKSEEERNQILQTRKFV